MNLLDEIKKQSTEVRRQKRERESEAHGQAFEHMSQAVHKAAMEGKMHIVVDREGLSIGTVRKQFDGFTVTKSGRRLKIAWGEEDSE